MGVRGKMRSKAIIAILFSTLAFGMGPEIPRGELIRTVHVKETREIYQNQTITNKTLIKVENFNLYWEELWSETRNGVELHALLVTNQDNGKQIKILTDAELDSEALGKDIEKAVLDWFKFINWR